MSKTAKKLIRQAVKAIDVEDGASVLGCYRDVITEVLHLAYKKLGNRYSPAMLDHWICSMGYDAFKEELEIIEMGKVKAIPNKNLPLHSVDEFQFDTCKTYFEERLKTGG